MDRLSNFLSSIMNAQRAHHSSLECGHTKLIESVAHVLSKDGYLGAVRVFKDGKTGFKMLAVDLVYTSDKGKIQKLDRISTPSNRKYTKSLDIRPVLDNLGYFVISTSKGVMNSHEAKKRSLGGEVLCKVY